MKPETLRLTEIFLSLQGEANTVGWPTIFIRLTGCPLRCDYCDTAYAFTGGKIFSFADILHEVQRYRPIKMITVTGGEPLAQPNVLPFLSQLCDQDYDVSLETSGALPVHKVDERVVKVVDFKTPSSGESHRNDYANIDALSRVDQVKFVVKDREDYQFAKTLCEEHDLHHRFTVLFSPSHQILPPQELADWILADRWPVRLQVQLHKYIWGDLPGK